MANNEDDDHRLHQALAAEFRLRSVLSDIREALGCMPDETTLRAIERLTAERDALREKLRKLLLEPQREQRIPPNHPAALAQMEYSERMRSAIERERMQRPAALDELRDSIALVPPLPRCAHGSALADGSGERLCPPCGCRWQLGDGGAS